MRGLEIRIADTERQEKSRFPNVITQSETTETRERRHSVGKVWAEAPVWLGGCLNETVM